MAANSELERHRQDWHGFVRLMGYTIASIVVLLILMATFLV
ncbi:MAG: aa3-type cytochrome c oxidase subunit IV [Alphaproteobacteria bacterium]